MHACTFIPRNCTLCREAVWTAVVKDLTVEGPRLLRKLFTSEALLQDLLGDGIYAARKDRKGFPGEVMR